MNILSDPDAYGLATQPRWHRPLRLLMGGFMLVLFAWIILLVQRTPADAFAAAFEVSAAEREKVLSLQEAVRALRTAGPPSPGAVQRLRASIAQLQLAPLCPPSLGPVLDRPAALLSAAAAELEKAESAGDAYRRTQLANTLHGHLAELDRLVDTCLKADVDGIQVARKSLRLQIYVMGGLLALCAAGVAWLLRRDQQALRRQLRFNQQLIDAVPLPLSLRSTTGEFLLVNRAFEDKHGVSRLTVTGRSAAEALTPAAAERIASMDRRALEAVEAVEDIFEIDDELGQRHVQVRVQALGQPGVGLAGIIGVQTDVTALRLKEAELLRANARLSQLSAKILEAQEDERERIARDLHDELGQILTALKLQLGSLARREHIDRPQEAFVATIDLAEEALRHTRDLSASLHPHLLGDLGLQSAVGWLIERFIRPSLVQVDLRCDLEPPRGPQAIELVAFRVVQEALTNVIRHSRASRAGVILEARDGSLSLEVIDDGIGFAATEADLQRVTSVGLASMRDRVGDLGGTLQIDSRPGVGTSLRARLPWDRREG